MLSMIAAMAANRVIGCNDQLPWHLPADLAWFKQQTLHKPIIMGRQTFATLKRPLAQRTNIVVSRSAVTHPDVIWAASPDQALRVANSAAEVMVIGGGQLYHQLLPFATRLYLTHIAAEVAGDTYFPRYDPTEWQTLFSEAHGTDDKHAYAFRFEILQRLT